MVVQNITIDVNFIIDWLLSRRLVKPNWPLMAETVLGNVVVACDMIPEQKRLLHLVPLCENPSEFTGYECRRIFEGLLKTEDSSKTLFGSYNSPLLKKWNAIINAFQKDNLLLGQGASVLNALVTMEIPIVMKQIERQNRLIQECEQKKSENANSAKEFELKFQNKCKSLQIQGKHVKTELLGQAKAVDSLYQPLVERIINELGAGPLKLFDAFTAVVSEEAPHSLPTLRLLIAKGRLPTVGEWRRGEDLGVDVEKLRQNRLDYITSQFSGVLDPVVDAGEFEDEDQAQTADNDEIDWGDLDSPATDNGFEIISSDDTGGFDIEVGDEGGILEVPGFEVTGEIEASKPSQDSLTLLDYKETRDLLMCDIMQLRAFYSGRSAELEAAKGEGSVVDSVRSRIQSLNDDGGERFARLQWHCEIVQSEASNSKVIGQYLSACNRVIHELLNDRLQQLLSILGEPKAVHRIGGGVIMLKERSQQCRRMVSALEERSKMLEREIDAELVPKRIKIQKRILELKKCLEDDIGKKYEGNLVQIRGNECLRGE